LGRLRPGGHAHLLAGYFDFAIREVVGFSSLFDLGCFT
jgi:hypothetical protein